MHIQKFSSFLVYTKTGNFIIIIVTVTYVFTSTVC